MSSRAQANTETLTRKRMTRTGKFQVLGSQMPSTNGDACPASKKQSNERPKPRKKVTRRCKQGKYKSTKEKQPNKSATKKVQIKSPRPNQTLSDLPVKCWVGNLEQYDRARYGNVNCNGSFSDISIHLANKRGGNCYYNRNMFGDSLTLNTKCNMVSPVPISDYRYKNPLYEFPQFSPQRHEQCEHFQLKEFQKIVRSGLKPASRPMASGENTATAAGKPGKHCYRCDVLKRRFRDVRLKLKMPKKSQSPWPFEMGFKRYKCVQRRHQLSTQFTRGKRRRNKRRKRSTESLASVASTNLFDPGESDSHTDEAESLCTDYEIRNVSGNREVGRSSSSVLFGKSADAPESTWDMATKQNCQYISSSNCHLSDSWLPSSAATTADVSWGNLTATFSRLSTTVRNALEPRSSLLDSLNIHRAKYKYQQHPSLVTFSSNNSTFRHGSCDSLTRLRRENAVTSIPENTHEVCEACTSDGSISVEYTEDATSKRQVNPKCPHRWRNLLAMDMFKIAEWVQNARNVAERPSLSEEHIGDDKKHTAKTENEDTKDDETLVYGSRNQDINLIKWDVPLTPPKKSKTPRRHLSPRENLAPRAKDATTTMTMFQRLVRSGMRAPKPQVTHEGSTPVDSAKQVSSDSNILNTNMSAASNTKKKSRKGKSKSKCPVLKTDEAVMKKLSSPPQPQQSEEPKNASVNNSVEGPETVQDINSQTTSSLRRDTSESPAAKQRKSVHWLDITGNDTHDCKESTAIECHAMPVGKQEGMAQQNNSSIRHQKPRRRAVKPGGRKQPRRRVAHDSFKCNYRFANEDPASADLRRAIIQYRKMMSISEISYEKNIHTGRTRKGGKRARKTSSGSKVSKTHLHNKRSDKKSSSIISQVDEKQKPGGKGRDDPVTKQKQVRSSEIRVNSKQQNKTGTEIRSLKTEVMNSTKTANGPETLKSSSNVLNYRSVQTPNHDDVANKNNQGRSDGVGPQSEFTLISNKPTDANDQQTPFVLESAELHGIPQTSKSFGVTATQTAPGDSKNHTEEFQRYKVLTREDFSGCVDSDGSPVDINAYYKNNPTIQPTYRGYSDTKAQSMSIYKNRTTWKGLISNTAGMPSCSDSNKRLCKRTSSIDVDVAKKEELSVQDKLGGEKMGVNLIGKKVAPNTSMKMANTAHVQETRTKTSESAGGGPRRTYPAAGAKGAKLKTSQSTSTKKHNAPTKRIQQAKSSSTTERPDSPDFYTEPPSEAVRLQHEAFENYAKLGNHASFAGEKIDLVQYTHAGDKEEGATSVYEDVAAQAKKRHLRPAVKVFEYDSGGRRSKMIVMPTRRAKKQPDTPNYSRYARPQASTSKPVRKRTSLNKALGMLEKRQRLKVKDRTHNKSLSLKDYHLPLSPKCGSGSTNTTIKSNSGSVRSKSTPDIYDNNSLSQYSSTTSSWGSSQPSKHSVKSVMEVIKERSQARLRSSSFYDKTARFNLLPQSQRTYLTEGESSNDQQRVETAQDSQQFEISETGRDSNESNFNYEGLAVVPQSPSPLARTASKQPAASSKAKAAAHTQSVTKQKPTRLPKNGPKKKVKNIGKLSPWDSLGTGISQPNTDSARPKQRTTRTSKKRRKSGIQKSVTFDTLS